MPPKGKKNSKSAAKLSNSSEQSVTSPRNTPSALTPNPDSEPSVSDISSVLEEASSKYPSFIGKTAFVGRITEGAAGGLESKGCKIWLSESSMVSYSLAPGSTVSVSLASSRNKFSSNFPLRSFVDECERHFVSDYEDKMVDEVGIYFALAAVFPSSKILKNGVRLSSSLSSTMGFPASGRLLFVYPIRSQSVTSLAHENGKFHGTADNCISIFNCKELYLELVSSNSEFAMNCNKLPHIDFPAETTNAQAENGKISSPKTPFFSQSKLSFPSSSNVSSPRYEESVSNSSKLRGTSFDSIDIQEVLGDESAKNLLQTCAASWLCSRSLLCGNLVMIPILSKLCFFQVVGANKMSANHNILNVPDESNHDMFPQTLDLVDHVDDAFMVDHKTKIYLYPPLKTLVESTQKRGLLCQELDSEKIRSHANVNISKLGGLSKEYALLKDIIISSSVKGTLSSLGIRPIKGVLLHGPPGTGKTSLAQLCAHDAGINLFHVNGPEIVSQYYGESERALHEVFDSASKAAPAVVFIDELDSIAPARKDGSEELSQRIVATLLNLMDGIITTEGLLVIAATNRPDSIEPALRRPGRLDREIEFGVPSPDQRYDILLALLRNIKHTLLDMEVQYLATATHGFVGADLDSLCNEAALVCLRRYADFQISCAESHCNTLVPNVSAGIMEDTDSLEDTNDLFSRDNLNSAGSSILESPVKLEALSGYNVSETCTVKEDILRVTFGDFEKARSKVRPSAMREVILEVPKVRWEDVGGQKEVKMQLMEAVEWPQKHQDSLKRIGTRPPTGVLMFGPPGCSKTLLARAVASEAGLNFLAVKGPELFSKWVGESEKAVRSIFAKARENAPSIIFFDEIDGLAIIRGKESDGVSVADRVMSQLLVELDGLRQRVNVTVIAATNRPDNIDPALLRPGRFDRLLYVGPPNEADREDIFKIHLRKIPCSSDVCTKELAHLTKGCTGADISLICREAAVAAIEETLDASEITMKHLKYAAKQVQPSEIQSDQELLMKFQRFIPSTTAKDDFNFKPSSSRSSWIPFWTLIKSIALSFYRFPAAFLQSKSSSIS